MDYFTQYLEWRILLCLRLEYQIVSNMLMPNSSEIKNKHVCDV